MSSVSKPIHSLVSLFAGQQCWMIDTLADRLHYSIPSVRRFLAKIGYYNSFTHNGRWYTLRSIPKFSRDGLWFHKGIGFSRSGSLTNTLINLTTRSPAGMTAEQLGDKLHCRCHTVLVHLCRKNKLQRQKVGRSYVYIAVDTRIAAEQCNSISIENLPQTRLPAEIAILVLAEFIRRPQYSFEQLAETILSNNGVSIKPDQIEILFEQHNLKKKIQIAVAKPYER